MIARLPAVGLATVFAACLLSLPVPAGAAGRCGKYKMDGAGNCLTPKFHQCQRDWAKCNAACKKGDNACLDKCEITYAPHCGD